MTKKKSKKRAFTIVELVVVIAIIAILAAVLIPTFVNLVKRANEANALLEAKNLITEMLAEMLLGKEGDADLLVFSQKGNDVYAYGYDASAGRILAYKGNPVPVKSGTFADFVGTGKENSGGDTPLLALMLKNGEIEVNTAVNMTEGSTDWRTPAEVKKIVGSLNTKYNMIVFANYLITENFAKKESGGEEAHVHSWADDWAHDETHHWHNCTAGGCDITDNSKKNGYEAHVYDNDEDTTCNVCGYVRTVTPGHTHEWGEASYTWATDNSTCTATHICSVAGCTFSNGKETETVNSTSSVTQEATCGQNGEITYTAEFTNSAFATQTKKVIIEKTNSHVWDTKLTGNSNGHWYPCTVCGEKNGYVSHDMYSWIRVNTGNSEYHDKKCKDCGFVKEQEPHNWQTWGDPNLCAACGYKKTVSFDPNSVTLERCKTQDNFWYTGKMILKTTNGAELNTTDYTYTLSVKFELGIICSVHEHKNAYNTIKGPFNVTHTQEAENGEFLYIESFVGPTSTHNITFVDTLETTVTDGDKKINAFLGRKDNSAYTVYITSVKPEGEKHSDYCDEGDSTNDGLEYNISGCSKTITYTLIIKDKTTGNTIEKIFTQQKGDYGTFKAN